MKNPLKSLRLKRRAITVLAGMHFYGNPGKKLKIVGVTGTNGKTTIVTLLYRIMRGLGYKVGLISTVENIADGEIINSLDDKPVPGTTPDPITLHKLFNKMIAKGCEYVFMEVSSHALDQNRVAGVDFVGGIFTNLTHDHLDYHKNLENYFGAKKKFFKMLRSDAFALSNADDEYGEKMLAGIQAKKYTYGLKSKADFGEKLETKLIGDFNMYNVLAVYASLVLLGIDKERVKEQIKNVLPPKGRFDYIKSSSGIVAIVDYAHTPDALQNVLNTVQNIKEENSKIISIVGCGGDRDPMKRPKMGKIAVALSDVAIFTSDNPRSEDPNKIIEEMKVALSSEDLKKVKTIPNRREAIEESVKLARPGDVILCAGKGHEDYQEIKGVKHHFDDMEEFQRAYFQK